MKILNFPENFLWGSAISSYQVEGGIENNDWAEAGRQADNIGLGKSQRKDNVGIGTAGRACDHYNLYEKDFNLVKELGQNAHRFSIEWARVEPEEGKFSEEAIEHYQKTLQALRERGIEPFVTLWHFTLPIWFVKKGGFENPKAPEIFARYCGYVVRRLAEGDMARFWITINEPMVYASQGYLRGIWPPFKKNIFAFRKVIKTLISSHLASHNIILRHFGMSQNQTMLYNKESLSHNIADPNFPVKIGIAKNNIHFENIPFIDRFWNLYFLNKIKNHIDFIGLNYYFHRKFPKNENKEVSDMGWEIYPEGIYHVLKDLKKYNKPVYITENGLADAKDQKRAKFIKDHLRWAYQAMQEGVDLRGYFYWSLMDNFEWAHGFGPRFGLIEIDYKTMERKIRPSAFEYKKICETNSLETL